jgi:hypothetical protein
MALFLFKEPQVMSVNPLTRDADPGPSGGRHEQREAAAVRPEMQASAPQDAEEQPAEEIEEPGYGYGV